MLSAITLFSILLISGNINLRNQNKLDGSWYSFNKSDSIGVKIRQGETPPGQKFVGHELQFSLEYKTSF